MAALSSCVLADAATLRAWSSSSSSSSSSGSGSAMDDVVLPLDVVGADFSFLAASDDDEDILAEVSAALDSDAYTGDAQGAGTSTSTSTSTSASASASASASSAGAGSSQQARTLRRH
jgi:hypothetical protein